MGETIEFSVCEIGWEILEDCFGAVEGENSPLQEEQSGEDIEAPKVKGDKGDIYNPVVNQIYPNPIINDLYVNITTYEPGSIDIIITDIKGVIIQQEEDIDLPGDGKHVLPISFNTQLPMGMYRLNVINSSNQIIATQNLIIAK